MTDSFGAIPAAKSPISAVTIVAFQFTSFRANSAPKPPISTPAVVSFQSAHQRHHRTSDQYPLLCARAALWIFFYTSTNKNASQPTDDAQSTQCPSSAKGKLPLCSQLFFIKRCHLPPKRRCDHLRAKKKHIREWNTQTTAAASARVSCRQAQLHRPSREATSNVCYHTSPFSF